MIDRAIAGAVLVALLAGGATWGYKSIKESGRQEVIAAVQKANDAAMAKRYFESKEAEAKHAAINQKVITDYESKLQDQAASYDKRIAAINAAGGLRIPANRSKRPTTTSEATSPGSGDEASTIRLPERVEIDLYAYARKADEVRLQLGACQSWIRDNGFYGK